MFIELFWKPLEMQKSFISLIEKQFFNVNFCNFLIVNYGNVSALVFTMAELQIN